MSRPLTRVTDDLRAQYQRDGVVFVKGAFDEEWVGKLQAGAEHNLKHPGPLCDEHVQAGQPGACEGCERGQLGWRVPGAAVEPSGKGHGRGTSLTPPRVLCCLGRFHDDQFLWRRHDTFKHFIYDSPAAAVRLQLTQTTTHDSPSHTAPTHSSPKL